MSDFKRHLPIDNSVQSLHMAVNRLWDALEAQGGSGAKAPPTPAGTGTRAGLSAVGSSSSPGTAGAKGDKGDTGPAGADGADGADGSTASMLVGAEHVPEILMDQNGSVLTDENGYALIGAKVYTTVIVGAGTTSLEVLNAT